MKMQRGELVGFQGCLGYDYDKETKTVTITQRNRFFQGDEIEIVEPKKPFITLTVENMRNDKDEPIEVANHAEMTVKFHSDDEISAGAMVRKRRE